MRPFLLLNEGVRLLNPRLLGRGRYDDIVLKNLSETAVPHLTEPKAPVWS